jgi:hypothetical protein
MYQLIKIDLLDTYPLADIFDEEKYKLLTESENLKQLIKHAIGGFIAENPKYEKSSYNEWIENAENGGYELMVMNNFKEGSCPVN